MKVIAVVSAKGGVGKTTLTANLATALQHQGVATVHSAVPHGFVVRLSLPEASPADDPAAPMHDSGFSSRR